MRTAGTPVPLSASIPHDFSLARLITARFIGILLEPGQ
jgi:hypothetical protein